VEGLLAFLPAHSLVLQDSGFRAAWWMQRLAKLGHASITRLQTNEYACRGPRLPDGSYLVETYGSREAPLREPLILRIIEYRLAPLVGRTPLTDAKVAYSLAVNARLASPIRSIDLPPPCLIR